MKIDWRDISYLRDGTPSQRRAYDCLTELNILTALKPYDAILVSTVCNDIDIADSDLDIICEVSDHDRFRQDLAELYGAKPSFSIKTAGGDSPVTVASFDTETFVIEIFGQALPVERQNGYRHMMQTNRVIMLGGARYREAIRDLKRSGLKTEPAVAKLLGLSGDPYRAVLELENLSDEELRGLAHESRQRFLD